MSRRIEDLTPVVAGMCKTLLEVSNQKGIDLIITSTLRTSAAQLAYFSQGRKKTEAVNAFRKQAGLPPISGEENKKIVTQNLTSMHEFGCAVDVAIVKAGTAIWEIKAETNENNIPDYEEIGKIGEAIGFRWGGRFPKKDYVHFEYTGGLNLADLQAGKRPHENGGNNNVQTS